MKCCSSLGCLLAGAVAVSVAVSVAVPAALAAQTRPRAPTVELVPAELAGVVRDTAGNALMDVEIVLPVLGRSVRSGSDGRFVIAGVVPGFHEVWLRHIGNISVPFDWTAEEGKRVEIAVTLRPLPNTLDPVVVYANEAKAFSSTSMVNGIVVDSGGLPVPNAELQLIGTSRTTVSAADGSFEFRHVPSGTMTLRARRMGYSPTALMIELQDDDQRTVSMRIRRLDPTLDTVTITASSGYGESDKAWQEFGKRERWRSNAGLGASIGPQRLREAGGMPLDLLMRPYFYDAGSRAPTEIKKGNVGTDPLDGANPLTDDLACILENGIDPRRIPLGTYAASEVTRIEYYPASPPEREYTGTVEARMSRLPGCAIRGFGHPAYFVIWLKNAR